MGTVVPARRPASGLRYQRKYLYQKVERTLCQPPTKNESEVQFFYVDVSTLSPVNTTYQLRVNRMDDFVLRSAGGAEETWGRASFPSPGSHRGALLCPAGLGSSSASTPRQPSLR